MTEIPQDILTDMLLKFPVKFILRFRCVSKSMCTLIDSKDFNKLLATRNNSTTLFVRGSIYFLSLDSSVRNSPMKLQSSFKLNGMSRMGSCNYPQGSCEGSYDGLVCMSNGDGVVAIWNPTTSNYIKSPDSNKIAPLEIRQATFGFGYDSVHDEYKVVRIVQGWYAPFETAVTVFSAKTGIWKRVGDFPYRVVTYKQQPVHGVFVCGGSHWVATRKYYYDKENNPEYLIAAFDLATEEYRVVPMPMPCFGDYSTRGMKIGVLEDCLCLTRRPEDGLGLDVYIMKEYGVKESWHKVCSMRVRELRTYDVLSDVFRPLAYSSNRREILFVGDRNLFWYDLEYKTRKEIQVAGNYWYHERDVEVCGESVVAVGSGERIEGKTCK